MITRARTGSVILFAVVGLLSAVTGAAQDRAVRDLTTVAAHDAPVTLDGRWNWFPHELLVAPLSAASAQSFRRQVVELPRSLAPDQSRGVGTLSLMVLFPDTAGTWGIKLPYMSSANRVYLDGRLLGGSGSVAAPYRPQYQPLELFFDNPGGEAEITVQVANFHHRRMRLNRVFLGPAHQIHRITHLRIIRDAVIFGSLLLLAAYHLLIYFLYRSDRAFLYLASIAVVSAFRLGITGERLLVRLWPSMPAEMMMKIGYLPVFILLPLAVLYLDALSRGNDLRRPAIYARWAVVLLTAFVLIAPLRVYDWTFQFGVVILAAAAVWLVSVILRRPIFAAPRATVLVLGGIAMVVLAAVNDYLREIGAIATPELLSVAIVGFMLLQAYFLAWRFRWSFERNRALTQEVQDLNQTLETRILERTQALGDANRRLERISRTDGLTGLANRRYFDETLQREWHRGHRQQSPVAVILVDIDHFKAYNDSQGHLRGDDCLRFVADVLRTAARRSTDLVARYGGEEFVILLPGIDVTTAADIAEGLRTKVEARAEPHPATGAGSPGVITASFGVAAEVPRDREEPENLLRRADAALYQAKDAGRNQVTIDTTVSA